MRSFIVQTFIVPTEYIYRLSMVPSLSVNPVPTVNVLTLTVILKGKDSQRPGYPGLASIVCHVHSGIIPNRWSRFLESRDVMLNT
jgi:hypothetical protein